MPQVVLAVRAYAIAATMAPRELAMLFPPTAERVKVSKTHALVRYGETSWAVAHDFGAVVFIDVDEAEQKRVIDGLVARGAEPRSPLVESFSVELSPGAKPAARFDRVVVAELDGRSVELLSVVIAQSVAMEYYENDVDELVGELERFARTLAQTGRFRAKGRELMRFIGRGMATRTQVIHTLALLDAPAVTWENELLDRLHSDLRASFAIEDRYRGLDHKLRMIQDNLELLVDLTRHTRSIMLEVAVIVLIAIELLIGIVGRQ